LPSLHVLYEITFGVHRGIVLLCPLLLLVPVALAQAARRPSERGLVLTLGLIVVYYPMLNSSYFYWNGGWSTGPRHIVAMLPFACLILGFLWTSRQPLWRPVALCLGGVSLVLALLCASSGVFATDVPNEISDFIVPRFLDGRTTAVPVHFLGWRFRAFLPAFLAFWAVATVVIGRQLSAWMRERSRADLPGPAAVTSGMPPEELPDPAPALSP
jgi:hypothetical protein